MCELKVRVIAPQKDEQVAQDVIYARVEQDHVFLKDVLGVAHSIQNALISTIDIGKETLSLRQSSVVGPFLRFLEACDSAETSGNYSAAEESWNELKAKGDEIVRTLWRNHGRSS